MNNKIFYGLLIVLAAGLAITLALTSGNDRPKSRLGVEQPNAGRQHVAEDQRVDYKSAIPTSGSHWEVEAPWGFYDQELPNERVVHNMEHGGIVISYKPHLGQTTFDRVKGLFFKPFSDQSFQPNKVVMMPRQEQKEAIVMASWDRLMTLESYDQQKMIDYYLTNVGKSPEPSAN